MYVGGEEGDIWVQDSRIGLGVKGVFWITSGKIRWV